jgi:hypothetical protein
MSFSIRFIILINYAIKLVALYNNIVFYKSLNSVKNTIKSLLLK